MGQRAATAWGKALAQATAERRRREAAAASAAFEAAMAKLATVERHHHAAVLAAEAVDQRRHEAVLAAEADDRRRHEAVLVAEADDRRRHEAVLAAEANDRRHHEVAAALVAEQRCHYEAVLVADANNRPCHELAARAAEQALTLVEGRRRHEDAMRAALSAASSLADERPHHKVALSNLFDAAKERIQATCDLFAAPLELSKRTSRRGLGRHFSSLHRSILQRPMTTSCRLLRHLSSVRHFFLRRSMATSRRYVLVPELAIALVNATYLERPVLLSRCLPPNLTYCRGVFQRQLQPCWHQQPHLVARWCRHLRLPRRHHILPPFIPLLDLTLFIRTPKLTFIF